jgi:2-iminobutanoate/2-iminopropanoate deaminase
MNVPLSRTRSHQGWIFVSGQVGSHPGTAEIPNAFADQTLQAIENLKNALEADGASLGSVLKTTVFIRREEDFAEMNSIYGECFEEPYPARTTIVTSLARPEIDFEIEAVAYTGP